MCVITRFLSSSARYRAGRPPKSTPALRAFIAAELLRKGDYDITTVTAATVATGASRPSIDAATVLLQAGDEKLITDVLAGRAPLLAAAAKVRGRAKLIESFRQASPEDRAAFGAAVGVANLFDASVAPAL
jgi:hypothetical protein